MRSQVPLKEIVTVTEMSRMCRLSRARFYQLIGEGIFPEPSRNPTTHRPYFDREQQEHCLLIRKVNKGANGKGVIFYGCRLEAPRPRPKRKRFPISKTSKDQVRPEPVVTELRHGLAQLGMSNVTEQQIRWALTETYPDGHRDVESAELLAAVFGELQCRYSTDKLSG